MNAFYLLPFLLFSTCRNDLIDINIEETVARMQTVIELGRYIRDKKIVPTKVAQYLLHTILIYFMRFVVLQFPLPEVVVIHQDPICRQQLKEMERYILEELNIRSLVLAEDDTKYGVKLVGEPDNDRLGKRLKKEFKMVSPAVKSR